MAVTSATSSISYTGNNSTTTSYAVPFVFLENSHLAATAKVTATGVETAVTLVDHIGAGNPNGGNVRTAVAVPATSTLTIFRTVPATQTTTYQEGGDFPAASHERALDKLTMLSQQAQRGADRAIKVTEADGQRTDMIAVANSLVGLDENKQPKAMTVSEIKSLLAISGTTLSVPAGIKTFADAGERALAVPEFTGQLGTQRDTADIYISTGTAAGNWSLVDENMSLADFASGFFTADATGRGKFASGFVDTALIADSTSTTTGVTNAKLRQSSALSVVGRSADTSGAVADIAAANDGEVLRRNGTEIGFGQLASSGIADGAITPAKLNGAQSGSAPIYGARAWVNFNGTGTVAIRASGNVSSITDNGTGDYTVNFTTAMQDVNYGVSFGCGLTGGTAGNQSMTVASIREGTAPLTTSVRFTVNAANGSASVVDVQYVTVAVFR